VFWFSSDYKGNTVNKLLDSFSPFSLSFLLQLFTQLCVLFWSNDTSIGVSFSQKKQSNYAFNEKQIIFSSCLSWFISKTYNVDPCFIFFILFIYDQISNSSKSIIKQEFNNMRFWWGSARKKMIKWRRSH